MYNYSCVYEPKTGIIYTEVAPDKENEFYIEYNKKNKYNKYNIKMPLKCKKMTFLNVCS